MIERNRLLSIGIVGCGAIGRVVAKGVEQETFPAFLAGLTSRTKSRAELLAKELKTHPPVLGLEKLLAESELIVEAVSPESARDLIKRTLCADRDIVVLTVCLLYTSPSPRD